MEGADDSDVTGDSDGEAEAETESVEDLVAAAASASLAARNKVRESMQAEIEAFLARGGKIQTIDDNVMADPPRKPDFQLWQPPSRSERRGPGGSGVAVCQHLYRRR